MTDVKQWWQSTRDYVNELKAEKDRRAALGRGLRGHSASSAFERPGLHRDHDQQIAGPGPRRRARAQLGEGHRGGGVQPWP